MCKVLMIPGIKPEKVNKAWDFVQKARSNLTRLDNDGFGYAAITETGELFGERWVDPKDAFVNRYMPDEIEQSFLDDYMGALTRAVEYNTFGEIHRFPEARTIIAHARMATCGKGLRNVHPFVIDNKALIHNGVIRNTEELEYKNSSCDSECILTRYLAEKVPEDAMGIQDLAHALKGYYACGVLGTLDMTTEEGVAYKQPYLDIFKDNAAQLVACYIEELETLVFCTNFDIVQSTCRDTNMNIGFVLQVSSGTLMRLNAVTGQALEVIDFDPNYKFVPTLHQFPNTTVNTTATSVTQAELDEMDRLDELHSDPYFVRAEGYSKNKP